MNKLFVLYCIDACEHLTGFLHMTIEYLLLTGFGSVFTYMVALNTNVINFGDKHTGKVVGLLNAFFAGSPSVFATVYYKIFTEGDQTVVENQNFGSFMIFFAVIYGIANILCMIFLRVYSQDDKLNKIEVKYYKENGGVILNGDVKSEIAEEKSTVTKFGSDDSDEHMSLKQIACNLDFLSFVLMFAFVSSVGLVYTNNITVASRSVGLNNHNDDLVIIIPITNAIVSASTGILSDILKEKIPRLVLVTGSCFLFVLSQLLIMIYAESLVVFVIATVCAGAGIGVVWSLSPTIMKEMFYVRNLGRNWGIALFFAALVAFASQETFGALYDNQLSSEGDEFCYGIECIRGGYAVFLGVAVTSALCGLVILLRQRCCKSNEKDRSTQ